MVATLPHVRLQEGGIRGRSRVSGGSGRLMRLWRIHGFADLDHHAFLFGNADMIHAL